MYEPTSPQVSGTLEPYWRDNMDAQRSMWRRTPNGEYPDGYLGTIQTRRGDRLVDAVKKQLNRKVYDRGVHKGERINAQDYFWPDWIEPLGRKELTRQVSLRPWTPDATLTERLLVNDGKPGPALIDPERQSRLRRLGPNWR